MINDFSFSNYNYFGKNKFKNSLMNFKNYFRKYSKRKKKHIYQDFNNLL